MASTIVQIENLVKRYGSFVALDHLNLNVSGRGNFRTSGTKRIG